MGALEVAHDELRQQRAAAQRLEAEGNAAMITVLRILDPLEDIVDHARRIDLETASDHYRAEKAGPLLTAAVRLQRNALVNYAGGDDCPPAVFEQLHALASDLINTIDQVRLQMWEVARGA